VSGGGVFINYRSDDSPGYAPLLYAELCRQFGRELVFLDNESIPVGHDFAELLLTRVREATTLLALIGPNWLTSTGPNGRRIDDSADWTRRELIEAFNAGVLVIPVLIDDAVMPAEKVLPSEITALSRCQYRRLRHREASADIARLVADLVEFEPWLGRAEAFPPHGRVVVGKPPALADVFQERPALRDRLTRVPGVQVLVGDGGTGKTQLAAAAFAAALSAVEIAIWVTATSRSEVISTYARSHAAIHATAIPTDTGETELLADRALAWLSDTPVPWMMVLDDVEDPADLIGLWPTGPAGRVLVTTRRRDAAIVGKGEVVEVDVFTATEAVTYVGAKMNGLPGLPARVLDEAAELAAELGYLPLALSHAAAAIVNDGIRCADYRLLLADRNRRLAEVLPNDPTEAGDQYTRTVVSTWSLARERADRLAPAGLAGAMLNVVGFLDSNGVPEAVLTSGAVRRYLSTGLTDTISVAQARRTVRNLWRLSLVNHDPDDDARSVRIHALAHRAGREQVPLNVVAVVVRVAADALTELWPGVGAGTLLGQALRANAAMVVHHRSEALWEPARHPLLCQLGSGLIDSGMMTNAVTYFAELTETAVGKLGRLDPFTLTARHLLARARADSVPASAAEAEFAAVLDARRQVLGALHPDTLSSAYEVAWWHGKTGDPAGAVARFESVREARSRVLGPDHPDTLRVRNSLARWKGRSGDLPGAIAAFEQLLVDEFRVLGSEHPDTLATRNNLAHVRGRAGDAAGAMADVREESTLSASSSRCECCSLARQFIASTPLRARRRSSPVMSPRSPNWAVFPPATSATTTSPPQCAGSPLDVLASRRTGGSRSNTPTESPVSIACQVKKALTVPKIAKLAAADQAEDAP
jgi:hypothetical protein